MPELPEVQTIVNELNQQVCGQQIRHVEVMRPSIIGTPLEHFSQRLTGATIEQVHRAGKFLVFQLQPKMKMVAHLRMTGKFTLSSKEAEAGSHDRAYFYLANGTRLAYSDIRCFGTLELLSDEDEHLGINKLGLDPWSEELTVEFLHQRFKKRSVTIKGALLDQGIIAGIGNIYASEILFSAQIDPRKNASQLTKRQCKIVIDHCRLILEKALQYNGTSISDYRRVDDKTGEFQNFLKVYGKNGHECPVCSNPILKIKQQQRSTFLCNHCQH